MMVFFKSRTRERERKRQILDICDDDLAAVAIIAVAAAMAVLAVRNIAGSL